jgi:zinc protease
MKKNKFFALFLILCFAFTVTAQVNLNAPIPVDPNVRIGKLENGLTYYIRKNAKPEKKIELRLAVNAGSILEREDQQGLAHFLEHMAFNGTKNFKKNELVSYLQSIGVRFGADLNAYTSFNETVYILPIPTENKELVDKGLLVLSDWASAIELTPEEVNKERGVVLEELRLGKGADQRMRDRYFPKLFQNSQYAKRLPIGKKEVLEKFDMKALVDFYEDWYRPDLMAIVAVGDLDPDEMEKKIRQIFSPIKAKRANAPKRPDFPVPDHKETLVAVETDKEAGVTSTQLLFKKPPEKRETLNDYRRDMVKSFYNGMLNARFDELRQSPNPPFVFGGASFSNLVRGKNAYSMFAVTDPKSVKTTIAALLQENKRVQEHGFTEGEFLRQKERFLTGLENRFKEKDKTESGVFADNYVYHFLEKNPVPGIEFQYDFAQKIVPTITLAEINALAKDTTADENLVVVVTGGEQKEAVYPTETEILALLKSAREAKTTAYAETVSKEPLVEKLPPPATIAEEKTDAKFGLTFWKLSNGVNVVLKPTDFQSDQILMRGWIVARFGRQGVFRHVRFADRRRKRFEKSLAR